MKNDKERFGTERYHLSEMKNPTTLISGTTKVKWAVPWERNLHDGQLRKKAIESNVTVKGIIYIFDHLVECEIITPQYAVIKLQELMKHNSRLPKSIIQERIEKWSE